MEVKVGKKYRGLINGCIFKVNKEVKKINDIDTVQYEIESDGKKITVSKTVLDHCQIEEVE